ncbi:hypothetical protein [Kitasatospora sp. DSM 101779]|uniref:hypothetical protein n=1 Tax=Kitasatospora sp. DSM 101779 TaxID=2853165 RepID=UPI0021D9154F|nr:hypothetical protein [Kitasatospora sp. DSM 101779]MCU7822605.1 hypothetical protein [Kitasatospora sp. DSM 101779]
MRRVVTARAQVLVRAAGRAHLRWVGPAALLCAAAGWWLFGPVAGGDGPALGILAAGGWGLGLLPVHTDRRLTGPARRPRTTPPDHDGAGPAAGPDASGASHP